MKMTRLEVAEQARLRRDVASTFARLQLLLFTGSCTVIVILSLPHFWDRFAFIARYDDREIVRHFRAI